MAKPAKLGESDEDTKFGGQALAWLEEKPVTANKSAPGDEWIDEGDAPDLSAPDYQAKFAATPPRCARD